MDSRVECGELIPQFPGRVKLFGSPALVLPGAEVRLDNHRPSHLALYLLLRDGEDEEFSDEELIDALGVSLSDETLRGYVSQVRQWFGSDIVQKVRQKKAIVFRRHELTTDLSVLASLNLDAQKDREAALEILRQGDLLEGISPPWASGLKLAAARQRYRQMAADLVRPTAITIPFPFQQAAGGGPAPELDFRGEWHTLFSYDDGKPHREGMATISTDTSGQLVVNGRYLRSDAKDKAYANWRSLCCRGRVERPYELVLAYESTRYGMTPDQPSFNVYGLEMLTVDARDASGRPTLLTGHFFRFDFPDSPKRRLEPSGGKSTWTRVRPDRSM